MGQPMDLHFTIMEVVAVIVAVVVVALVSLDGECHWMEGALLLGVYVILALAFYHLPKPKTPPPAPTQTSVRSTAAIIAAAIRSSDVSAVQYGGMA